MTGPEAPALFEMFAAHCFFNCGHIERGADSRGVHDAMETHYEQRHRAAIDRLVEHVSCSGGSRDWLAAG